LFEQKYFVPLALIMLLLFLLSLGWGMNVFLDRSAALLLKATQKIELAIKEANWTKAKKHFQQTKKEWDEVRKYWPLLIHHQEMDRIEESFAKIKSYLDHQDSNHALAEIYVLHSYIQHIPESKALSLQNIF
jgi:hypothetical protein